MRRREFIALGCAALVVGCRQLGAEDIEMRIGHADNVRSSKHQAFLLIKSRLETRSADSVTVSIFPSGQLGSERELVEQTQAGTVHVTCVSNGTLVPFASAFALLDIPFQFDSYADARRILNGAPGRELLASLDDGPLIGLGFWLQGYRHLTTRSRRVATVDDMRGLKIRTMQAPLHVLAFEALGATPVPMAWSEVYSALQQGVIDGQENPLSVIYDEQLFRVQANISLTGHILDPMPVIANREWFENLRSNLREQVRETFAAATESQWGFAEQAESQYLELLHGRTEMQITQLTAEARGQFRDLTQRAVVARVRQQLGDAVVSRWMGAVGNASA